MVNDSRNVEVLKETSYIPLYTISAIVLAIATIVVVATMAIVRPESGSTITIIIGVTFPVIMGFYGAALKDMHKGINGRMSQLLEQKNIKTETDTRSGVIRDLNTKLDHVEVGSPEYMTLLDQIRIESIKHFDIKERRVVK